MIYRAKTILSLLAIGEAPCELVRCVPVLRSPYYKLETRSSATAEIGPLIYH